jgi:fucose permease
MTLLGPMLPALCLRLSLSDAQGGYLFTTQFASSTLGMIFSGVSIQRRGYRWTLRLGVSLMALGVAALAHANWVTGLFAVGLYGLGMGMTAPAGNLFIAAANAGRWAASLHLPNSSWCIWARGGPFLVSCGFLFV